MVNVAALIAGAGAARTRAQTTGTRQARSYWSGYLAATAAVLDLSPDAVVAALDRDDRRRRSAIRPQPRDPFR